ncbi:hypothetical protein HZA39_03245 [Candidatus Peregrinibacteria bacterium]|nr:hypothetical protein [Candidatus Peregrinibacteria bacterium]
MKRYKVGLALKIPSNFEIEVNAVTKKEALRKALGKYHNNEFDEDNLTNVDWENLELDINEKGNIDDIGNGICIEEI